MIGVSEVPGVVHAPRKPPLVLASGSPRRRELLLGLDLQFRIVPAEIDETPESGEGAAQMVARLSAAKAQAVSARFPDALVVAADTIVVVDGEMLAKPRDDAENLGFLKRLSARTHEVLTGHTLRLDERTLSRVVRTEVEFRELAADEMRRYVESGEGRDKAGGYAIQGRGAALVPRIEGCYFNVVGLSLATVVELAQELGVSLV